MKRNLYRIACASVLVGSMAFALTGMSQNAPQMDRYIVTVRPGSKPLEVAAAHAVRPGQVYTHVLNGFAAQIPPGRAAALANDPRVESLVVDQQVFAFGKPVKPPPTDPGQATPAGVVRVGAKLVTQTGAGIGVAILDTGLDFTHRDLRISGASFVSPGFTYTTSAQDDDGHGTHVGGIVAALNNGVDVVGVAPGATLYAVKVLDYNGSGYDSDIIAGLDWVLANRMANTPAIRVINMSLGRSASEDDSLMHEAIQRVVNAGINVVVAAGNDQAYEVSQMVPAGFPEVIAVASATAKIGTSNTKRVAPIQADTASYFTTDGKFDLDTGVGVAISAPGEEQENVQYPYIRSVGILSTALGGGTTRMSGTSMASPHVAGVVALLLEKNSALDPVNVKARVMTGDKDGSAPMDSPTSSYTYDGEREGIVYAPLVLK